MKKEINRVRGRSVVKAGILGGVAKEGFPEEVTFEQRPKWSKGARQTNA